MKKQTASALCITGALALAVAGTHTTLHAAGGGSAHGSLHREVLARPIEPLPPARSATLPSAAFGEDPTEPQAALPVPQAVSPAAVAAESEAREAENEVQADGTIISAMRVEPGEDTTDRSPAPAPEVSEPPHGSENEPPPDHASLDARRHGYASVAALEAALHQKLGLRPGETVHVWAQERHGRPGVSVVIRGPDPAE
jgi:hypothetical protein